MWVWRIPRPIVIHSSLLYVQQLGNAMKRRNHFGIVATFAAMVAMLIVQPVLAGEHLANTAPNYTALSVPKDVELGRGGVLQGQVLDTQGSGISGSPIVVFTDGKEFARGSADSEGQFQFAGLRGGTYQVLTEGGGATYRLWAPNTSPPGSVRQVAIAVSADPVVRAQHGVGVLCGQGGFWSFVSNPWISAALITAAIAIPIAISNDTGS